MERNRLDFFISYSSTDEDWASWIGWILEEQGFSLTIQAWDFSAGSNFVLEMQKAASEAARTLAVLSPAYLESTFTAPEWAAAFANDPNGVKRSLVPIRVRECEVTGLLRAIVHVDLVGLDEDEARERLLTRLSGRRAKPASKPRFPADGGKQKSEIPRFPGSRPAHYMPNLRRSPSDLEKRRFLQAAFECLAQHFQTALKELAARHEGVDYDLRQITSAKYVAEVFVLGESRARCKFWIADRLSGGGIAYSETDLGWEADNCYNEMLTVADNELALRTLMGMGWGGEEQGLDPSRLDPGAAAEYLWRRFASRLR
jgi:hypothetical protein